MARDTYNPGTHVPKVVRCNAGRDEAAVYKNLGNSQRIKFLWADTVTLVSGTYEAVSSGTFGAGKSTSGRDSYHPGGGYYGKTLEDLYVFATPMAAVSGTIWVSIDTSADTVTVNSTAAPADDGVEVALLYFTT
jgi:hypothetical protein